MPNTGNKSYGDEDVQSLVLGYSYEKVAPDHVIMHRVVDSESVIQFGASALNGKPLKVERGGCGVQGGEALEFTGKDSGKFEWTS